jgi:HlyD family secretion protein
MLRAGGHPVTDERSAPGRDIARTLELGTPGAARRRIGRWIAVAGAVLAAAIVIALLLPGRGGEQRYQTAKVTRGNLTVIVTATGTLQPTNQVDVGSELSGIVKTVEADFNDRVKVGQVLARLDTTRLEAQVLQSEAAVRAAEARARESEANENEMRRKLARAKELFEQKYVSEEALVSAQAAADRAVATLQSTRSQADQARATLAVDRTNLAKSVIRSPINGTVLARKVEPGQTVAATLQAPVLFTLAEDLTKMELHVDVDEADVGQVKLGQSATFTVDAHPGRAFPSKVTEVRNAAKTVSGVVTYETVLAADNAELLLRPGMTGTANITVNQLQDVVLVPNAALRFTPPAAQAARSFVSRLLPIPPRPTAPNVGQAVADRRHQQVWILKDDALAAVPVVVGATDGRMTQIVGGEAQPGLEVLTDTLQTVK